MSMKLEEFARESRATHKGDKSGVPIVGLEHLIPQEIKFSGYDVDTENTFTKTFKKGQILFGRRRAYLKKAAIADFDGICSGDITVIEAIPGKVDPLLLPFIIQNDKFFDYAVSRSAGGLSPRVKWEHLKDYEFDLPPIEEQRILADKLWAAYRLKESYKKLLTATQEMVKSQFIEMYYNTHNKQTLESVCPIMNKGITPKYVESSSVLVINQACIHWDGQRLGNIKYHNEEIPVRKRILESGDVLLNATGNGTLGRCCVFICPSDNNTYINDGHVIALSTDRAVILPEVLNTYLSLNDTQAEIYRQYVTGSTNQVDIVFSDIKKMKVPVPSMDEQILFVEVLTQADKSEFVGCKSQFIEIFYGMETTPVKDYIDDSFPGEWGTEDKDGNGVKVIRTTNFTNSGKLNLADVVTRSIEDRKVVRKQIKKYDTILERSGGTADNPVGRVVLFEEDNLFLCNNFTQVLRFKDVDPRFAFYALYYFYQTNRTAIRSMGSKTTGIQNLNMSKYLEIGIPNASDEDQKAFVTIAEQADKSEFVVSMSQFIEMFGDTHMRSDHSRQWKEVVEIINGKDYKSIQVEDGGYPVYGTGGEMARASDYLSPANSILLGRKGTIDKPLLIREKYWNVDTAFGAVPDEKVLHYVYFYWHCKTIDFNVLNKGTTLPSTTKVDLLNLWIKIPSMEEQTRFGSIVEQADKSEFELRKSIEAIDQVIKSLINN